MLRRDSAFVVSCSETLSRISLEVRIVRITLKALEMLQCLGVEIIDAWDGSERVGAL